MSSSPSQSNFSIYKNLHPSTKLQKFHLISQVSNRNFEDLLNNHISESFYLLNLYSKIEQKNENSITNKVTRRKKREFSSSELSK